MFYDVAVTWKLWATLKADTVAAKHLLPACSFADIGWCEKKTFSCRHFWHTLLTSFVLWNKASLFLKQTQLLKIARHLLMAIVVAAKWTPFQVKQYRLCKVPFVINGTNEIVFYDSFQKTSRSAVAQVSAEQNMGNLAKELTRRSNLSRSFHIEAS